LMLTFSDFGYINLLCGLVDAGIQVVT
jgi:hypothetical protein